MKDTPLAKKSLGQHWLHDASTLNYICTVAQVNPSDNILEIGPGTATLTKLLVEKAGHVLAVELDANLANALSDKLKAPNLTVVNQDILKFDLTSLPSNYKVVANIPYYLTSKLLRVLSESSNPPHLVALLVQKELAERVAARPGSMSLLSVSVQFYWEVELGHVVPARLFTPAPKVDSQIIVLKHRAQPMFPDANTQSFFRVIKAGFSARRKTLLNSLSAGLRLNKEDISSILEKAAINPSSRPQQLSLEEWYSLYKIIYTDA